jgi:Putative transposase, YhgA-like
MVSRAGGTTRWSRWWFDVPVSVRPAVAPYLVQFAYLLSDLSQISGEDLRNCRVTLLAKLATICLKQVRTSADLIKILARWMDGAREVATAPNGLNALAQVLCYILEVDDHVPARRCRRSSNASLDSKPRKPS